MLMVKVSNSAFEFSFLTLCDNIVIYKSHAFKPKIELQEIVFFLKPQTYNASNKFMNLGAEFSVTLGCVWLVGCESTLLTVIIPKLMYT